MKHFALLLVLAGMLCHSPLQAGEEPGVVTMSGFGGHAPITLTWQPGLTIMAAVYAAIDEAQPFRDPETVRLIRKDKVTLIKLKEIRRDPAKDIALEPGDGIQVPQSIF